MRTQERMKNIAETLREAVSFKGPFLLKINGFGKYVTREEFLEFYVEWTIDQIAALAEEHDDIRISDLPDGGCDVEHEGETVQYTEAEVAEMERDYIAALERSASPSSTTQ